MIRVAVCCRYADMAELADALDLGSSGATRAGSSPVIRIKCEIENRFWVFYNKKGTYLLIRQVPFLYREDQYHLVMGRSLLMPLDTRIWCRSMMPL